MATVVEILADVDVRLPNSYTESWKLARLNDVQRKLGKYLEVEDTYDFLASSSMAYGMSTDIRTENITRVYTADTTAIASVTSTAVWTLHEYLGEDDVLEGNKYYIPNIDHYNTTGFSTEISLYPESTEIRVARVYYNTLLTDLTTAAAGYTPLWNSEWHDILKYGVMEIIAKSGNNPDVELANNYRAEYNEILRDIKKDQATKKWKRPKVTWNYADHTWG